MTTPTTTNVAAHTPVAPAGAPSLEYRSFLSAEYGEAHCSIWPEAGEASVTVLPWWFQLRGKPRPERPEDLLAHLRSNGRRAARAVRQFVRANGCEYLWTLTYATAAADRAGVQADLISLFTRLQAHLGKLPIVAVIERGKRNTRRLHAHLALPCWFPHATMEALWGHGYVYVGDPGRYPARSGSRQLAEYLSKYIAKEVAAEAEGELRERVTGSHRYQVTKGWSPIKLRRRFWSLSDAVAWLRAYYGEHDRAWAWGDTNLSGVSGLVLFYGDERIQSWKDPPGMDSCPAVH